MIGKTISHYKILEKLGEGGMGVVYKAEDTKLERTVALKFLSLTSIGDEEKKRFKREAKAAASLNHPNIATIHAIDEVDEQTFIAMEYIEGKSLQDIVGTNGGKPMPMDKAIDYATQTAAGLQAAHEKGITHRDIKSANIMVTEKGQIKIMDFGLAKLANRSKMTQLGTTLGTAAYMSPEQARGETVDHRADIWSLGVVLYEMISGQMPFKGDYEQAVIYSIQNEEPEPLTALRSGVPIAMDGIIAKALAKEASIRYQNVEELPADLKGIEMQPSGISRLSTTATLVTPAPRWAPRRVIFFVLAGLLGALAGGVIWESLRPTYSQPVMRFIISPSADEAPVNRQGSTLALSPDGRKFVYVGMGGQDSQLYIRNMGELDARPIPGTDGASMPFFSPDGHWLGFLADGKLKKVALTGGTPSTITEARGDVRGASWGANDMLVFTPSSGAGLWQVPAAGGKAVAISISDTTSGVSNRRWPEVLPGGKAVLFTSWTGSVVNAKIGLLSVETGNVMPLIEQGTHARYASGYLVYGSADQMLLAAPFDIERLQVTGPAIPILENVLIKGGGAGQFALSRTGSLLYLPSTVGEHSIVWVDRKGAREPLMEKKRRHFHSPRLSPDGTRLVISSLEGTNHDIWVYNLQQGTFSRLTFESNNMYPTWTPDGQRVAFSSDMAGSTDMYWVPGDGGGQAEPLLIAEGEQTPGCWSPDGKFLIFDGGSTTGHDDISVLPLDKKKPWIYFESPFDQEHPMLSPDGKWLAYISNESGRYEVYVRDFPKPAGKWQISDQGGTEPLWARNGKELFYRSNTQLVAVAIETEPVFTVGRREVLFEDLFAARFARSNYDIDPNGDRFVMIERGPSSSQFIVVLNWFEELRQKVSASK